MNPYGNTQSHYPPQPRPPGANYQGMPQQRSMNMGQGPSMGGRMPLQVHGQYQPHQQQQQLHAQQLQQQQQQQQQQPGPPRMQMSSMQQQQAQQQMRVPLSHQMNQQPSAQMHQQMPPPGGPTMGSSSMSSQSGYLPPQQQQQQLPPPQQQQQMPPPQQQQPPQVQSTMPMPQAQLPPKKIPPKQNVDNVLDRALNNRREAEFEIMFAQRYNDSRMDQKKKVPEPICLYPLPGFVPQRNDGRNRGRQDYKKGGGRKNDDRGYRY